VVDKSCQSESTEGSRAERFLGLYGSHDRRLYLYTLTLLPRPIDAEEVLQEANLVLWRRFDDYQCGTNFFAWACQIVRYKVLKFRERQARAARLIDPDVFDQLAELAVEHVESVDEFYRESLIDCMARLTSTDHELIRQRYFETMTVQAMATARNCSPSAVSKSLCRVRRLLLDCINAADEGHSDRERMP
jgi:RNA polymerase sigma-70 factor (ECF subfamily)